MTAGRTVRAVLCRGGDLLGVVSPFPVEVPWWAETESVTEHLRALLGVPAWVLRMITYEGGDPPRDGLVTYLVEVGPGGEVVGDLQPMSAEETDRITTEDPRRAGYARPGGPESDLAWAAATLVRLGRPQTGPATQVKTWNLSGVYRLPTASGQVWLKRTNPFQTDESAAIAVVAVADLEFVPTVLATDPTARRVLCDAVPGEDCWDPADQLVDRMLERWIAVQAELARSPGRLDDLPAYPLRTLAGRLARMLEDPALAGRSHSDGPPRCPSLAGLTDAERSQLADLIESVPDRIREVDALGLPDTVIHGDFHPGNWRSDGSGTVIMDWSDASVGHPVSDLHGLVERLPLHRRSRAVSRWADCWRHAWPGCQPEAALERSRPLLFLQAAHMYQRFLDHIEPSEWPYHHADPAAQLRLALPSPR